MPDNDTWVQVPTKNGSVGMKLSDLQEAREAKGPVTRSEEFKKQVVSGVMQKLRDTASNTNSDVTFSQYDRNSFEETIFQNIKLKKSIKDLEETTNSQISELMEKCSALDRKAAAFKHASSHYFKSRRLFIWISVILLSVCLFLCFTIYKQSASISSLNEKNNSLSSTVSSLKETNKELSSSLSDAESLISDLRTTVSRASASSDYSSYYVGNVNSMVFHRSSCSYLPDRSNREIFFSRREAIGDGYSPCGHCNP